MAHINIPHHQENNSNADSCSGALMQSLQAAQQGEMLESLHSFLGMMLGGQNGANNLQQMCNVNSYNQGFQNGAAYAQGFQDGLNSTMQASGPAPQSTLPETELSRGQSLSFGPNQVSVGQNGSLSFSQQGCHGTEQISIQNGQVQLPNGQSVAVSTRGVLVQMADGTQVGVGRNDTSSPANRWAVAGAGNQIPCSPPGNTTVIQLNAAGQVVQESIK